MQNSGKKLATTAILMVFVTLMSKALGMFRDILLASTFGTATEAIAYEAASRLPITLFDFALGGVVTAAFIPIFNELMVKEGREKAFAFANKYFNLILAVTVCITVLGVVFSGELVSFLAPDISAEAKTLASALCKLMFPMIIFTGIAFCFVGILQSFEKYTLPAIMSLVSNLVMVLYFFTLCSRFGVWGLSLALLVGWFLQAAIQAPSAHKLGFRYSPTLNFSDVYIKRALKMAFPILVCSWLLPVCNVINTRFASGFEDGSAITMVNYANRLYIIIVGIFSFVATNLLFPKISRAEAGGDNKGAREFTASSLKILLYIMIPLSMGIYLLAEPLIRVIYMRGEFNAHDAEVTAAVLKLFALGIPFMSMNEVLTKLFFAMQKVKAPMVASVISIGVNIALVSLLVKFIGFDGIALASSITIAVCTLINFALISKSGALFSKTDVFDILKMCLATALMCVSVFLVIAKTDMQDVFTVILCGAIGILVYAMAILVLRPTEIRSFIKRGKND